MLNHSKVKSLILTAAIVSAMAVTVTIPSQLDVAMAKTKPIKPTPTTTTIPVVTPVQTLPYDIYVSNDGNDSNSGTKDAPLKTLGYATQVVEPGKTIYVRGGTYDYSSTVALAKSGTETNKISIVAYPGEKPVFNFSSQVYGAASRGFYLTGDYWNLKGLEIEYAGDNGIKVEGSNNKIENCILHNNGDSGIQLGFAHETVNPNGTLCSNNEIVNCDSYLNFDFDNAGGDADGFSCKMHNGKGNKFIGCRSWRNSDDGWDLYETDWGVEITNCYTWHNGDKTDFDAIYKQKMKKKMSSYQGNGNGFKLGGNGKGGNSKGVHVVKNCVAFDNYFRSRKGFDQNSHQGGEIIENCLSFGNGYNYMFEKSGNTQFVNNISFGVRGSLDHEFGTGAVEKNNSWNLNVTANAADFVGLTEELAKAPRNADGSLPNNGFAKLVDNSDLIDKGTDIGLPYLGAVPDLGAYEKR
jgi:parallel beta-helix repeat protein